MQPRSQGLPKDPGNEVALNGKTCQYSNNTFQKRQKSFSFAKLNSQTCKGPHRPDAIRQRDANFQFSKTNKTVNG
jgi:hypothetical protein